MKHFQLLLPLFLFQLTVLSQVILKPQGATHKRYWENGDKKMEMYYIDSINRYKADWFFSTGNLALTEYYECDFLKKTIEDTTILDRDFRKCKVKREHFYENGQKRAEYLYDKGKLKGLFLEWYPNGQKMEESQHNDDKHTTNTYILYYSNGNIEKKGEFIRKRGGRDRSRLTLNLEAPLTPLHLTMSDSEYFLSGEPPDYFYAPNVNVRYHYLITGVCEYYSEDGKLRMEEYWKKGKLKKIRVPVNSYPKGLNIETGVLEYYSEDGKVVREETYKKGKLKKRVEYK